MSKSVHDQKRHMLHIGNMARLRNIILNCKKLIEDLYQTSDPNKPINKENPKHMHILGKQYDMLCKKMRHRYALAMFDSIATYINTIHNTKNKIKNRDILSAFAFGGFPEFSLEIYRYTSKLTGSGDEEDDIYTYAINTETGKNFKVPMRTTIRGKVYILAKKLMYCLYCIVNTGSVDQQLQEVTKFNEYLQLFCHYKRLFLSIDRQNKIHEQLMLWYDQRREIEMVEQNMNLDEKTKGEIIDHIKKRKAKTEKLLKMIDSGIDQQALDSYATMIDDVRKNCLKAFWDNINVKCIGKAGESIESLMAIIKEMKIGIKKLIPFKKREKVYKEIDELIDIDFISARLTAGTFSEENLRDLCDVFVKYLCATCSPATREKIVERYKNVVEGKYETNEKRYKNYIKFILDRINDVAEDVEAVKFAMMNGINIFS